MGGCDRRLALTEEIAFVGLDAVLVGVVRHALDPNLGGCVHEANGDF